MAGPGTPPSQTATTILILGIAFGSLLLLLGGTVLVRYMRAQARLRGGYRLQEPGSEYSSDYGSYPSRSSSGRFGSRYGSSYGSDGSGYRTSEWSSSASEDGMAEWKGVKMLGRSPRPYFISSRPKAGSVWSEKQGMGGLQFPPRTWGGC